MAVFAVIIHRTGRSGDALVSITDIKAEANPEHEAFRVEEPVRVTIEAAGSFEGGEADTALAAHGWIVDRETGDVVWQMRPANRPARGTFVLMRDTLALAPGIYDAYFAGLGAPMARTTREGGSLRERLSDALSGGGRGWVGDAARWRLIVRTAPGEDRSSADTEYGDPPEPDDLIWGTGPARSDRLYEVALRAREPVRVRFDALFEAAGSAPADSAYLMSAEGDTLWVARPASAVYAGGSERNRRQTEILDLAPGQYRAVYRSDGSHAVRDWDANPPWEPWRWGLRITPADSASAAGAFGPVDILNDFPRIAEIECVDEPSVTREVRFEVLEPLDATIVAVGEFVDGTAYDYATLSRNGVVVWNMEDADLQRAGGASKNRRAEETLTLERGIHTLRYVTDSSHHCRDFNSSDPDLEEFWGAVLLSADGEEPGDRVRLLEVPEPMALASLSLPSDLLVSIARVGNEREIAQSFRLAQAADVCIVGTGEMSADNRYDWGQITSASGARVFDMTYDNTTPAGGTSLNRLALVVQRLEAGTYNVRFESDGSHSYGNFGGDGPDAPELWGLHIWTAPAGREGLTDPMQICFPSGGENPPLEEPSPPPPPEAVRDSVATEADA